MSGVKIPKDGGIFTHDFQTRKLMTAPNKTQKGTPSTRPIPNTRSVPERTAQMKILPRRTLAAVVLLGTAVTPALAVRVGQPEPDFAAWA